MATTDTDSADAFRYPGQPLERRHGPSGYADYHSYRSWLRDEFTFRCVYCLIREQWGRVTGEFDLDHFLPQASHHGQATDYDNLLYACRPCNLRKCDNVLPDASQFLTREAVRIHPDGAIAGLTPEAARIIRVLCLNSPAWKRWRRMWMRIVELAAESDEDLLRELLGYPKDLPDLRALHPPYNTRPEGIEQSYFARRERGELPDWYVD